MTPTPDDAFLAEMRELEAAYLTHSDPIRRSGFGGGADRWEAERRPLTEAIEMNGSFLDVGCANGWLAKCVADWCGEQGRVIEPFGVDLGEALVAEAKTLLNDAWSADAWIWEPPRQFTYVYSLLELAPSHLVAAWLERLAGWVELEGRLIIGSYGSRSREVPPQDVPAALEGAGLQVAGEAAGCPGPVTRFAWAQL